MAALASNILLLYFCEEVESAIFIYSLRSFPYSVYLHNCGFELLGFILSTSWQDESFGADGISSRPEQRLFGGQTCRKDVCVHGNKSHKAAVHHITVLEEMFSTEQQQQLFT